MNKLLRLKNQAIVLVNIFITALILLTVISGCSQPRDHFEVAAPETGLPEEELNAHAAIFERRIEKVTEEVYVAVGYALANVIIMGTEEGNIIVDTTESTEAAEEIINDFADISEAPVRAIIYTHAHPDHVYGSPVFAARAADNFEVYAQSSHFDFFRDQLLLRDILNLRGIRQFGSELPEEYSIVNGIGPSLRFEHDTHSAYVAPTVLFEDELQLEIGGLKLVLKHAPGETEDQLMVWLPDKKVLLPGDNYYPAFPNLYTIRGSAPRDVSKWIASLDKMRALKPDHLVPSHGGPLSGSERINELLTAYRDAIQYVHDAVIRGANEGKSPDDLAAEIELPVHLAAYPELKEFYGQISFSVRSIYERYLGWFDGNATNLDPLHPSERAKRIAELAGGTEALIAEAEKALNSGDYQWAAELADMIMALAPEGSSEGREIKAEALMELGAATYNTNARHYYFTQALELAGHIDLSTDVKIEKGAAHAVPIEDLFLAMTVALDPAAAAHEESAAQFNISDTGEVYTIIVRRGIAELFYGAYEDADLIINVEENTWKELAAGVTTPALALATGKLSVEGLRLLALNEFMNLFDGP